ncbi:hypothetical protein QUA54_11530 [Microcoleus sp. MOSTC5]|uniref:hypothetical protein n=1 Tax=Microcoleus sp. MOSTC5 TaxID=3055378 RepID=UPI002FD51829
MSGRGKKEEGRRKKAQFFLFLLPTANCQLPTANCQLPTANCQQTYSFIADLLTKV